jgi:hypothetical protein
MIVDIITDHNNTINSNSNGRQYKKDNKTNQLSVKPQNIEAMHNIDLGTTFIRIKQVNQAPTI